MTTPFDGAFVLNKAVKISLETGYKFHFKEILRKLYSLFVFENLPDSIDETYLKQCLFLDGKAVFFENDGKLLALNCNYSDMPNVYYKPERVLISNPKLRKSLQLKIDEECVLVYNSEVDQYNFNPNYGGLFMLISRTAQLLADNDISINVAQKNKRLSNLVTAGDSLTKISAETAINKIYNGDSFVVAEENLVNKIRVNPFGTSSDNHTIRELIELHQYILAHFYHEIGINTMDNMKKAHMLEQEINTNDNLVRINIQNMVESWSKGIQKVNEMFGTNIVVSLSDLFQINQENLLDKIEKNDNVIDSSAADEEPEQEPESEPELERELEQEELDSIEEEESNSGDDEEPESEPESEEEPEQEPKSESEEDEEPKEDEEQEGDKDD